MTDNYMLSRKTGIKERGEGESDILSQLFLVRGLGWDLDPNADGLEFKASTIEGLTGQLGVIEPHGFGKLITI